MLSRTAHSVSPCTARPNARAPAPFFLSSFRSRSTHPPCRMPRSESDHASSFLPKILPEDSCRLAVLKLVLWRAKAAYIVSSIKLVRTCNDALNEWQENGGSIARLCRARYIWRAPQLQDEGRPLFDSIFVEIKQRAASLRTTRFEETATSISWAGGSRAGSQGRPSR